MSVVTLSKKKHTRGVKRYPKKNYGKKPSMKVFSQKGCRPHAEDHRQVRVRNKLKGFFGPARSKPGWYISTRIT